MENRTLDWWRPGDLKSPEHLGDEDSSRMVLGCDEGAAADIPGPRRGLHESARPHLLFTVVTCKGPKKAFEGWIMLQMDKHSPLRHQPPGGQRSLSAP